MRRLPHEFTRLQIENPLMSRAAVRANELVSCRAAVGGCDAEEVFVAGFLGCIEDDGDIHHDVDEQRLRRDERAQVLSLLHEPHRQSPPRLNQHGLNIRPAGQLQPRKVRAKEDESQVMHVPVMLSVLQQPGVVLRPLPPRRVLWRSQAAAGFPPVELPHHSRQEPAGPIGPQLAAVMPFAAGGIDGKKVWMLLDQRGNLQFGEIQRDGISGMTRGGHAPNVKKSLRRVNTGLVRPDCG